MNLPIEVALIALAGVALGSVLTFITNYILQRSNRSWQREQWLLDKRTEEYRELLSTLAANVERMARYSIDFGMSFPDKKEEQKRVVFDRAASIGKAVIQDRLFVAHLMREHEILDRWKLLAGERDFSSFWNHWKALHEAIVEAARKDLGIKG
jgi:hypothetical protein